MSFTRDDLTTYESKPATMVDNHDPWNPTSTTPEVKNPEADPQANSAEAEVDAAIAASVTEPTEKGDNDGSTTETQAEPVAAEDATPEGDKDPDNDELANDGKPRNRTQERISTLVAERNAAQKYAEYLLTHIEQLRSTGVQPPKQESQPASVVESKDDPAPTLESVEYDPVKFAKAQNEWIQKQVNKRVESAIKTIESRQNAEVARQAFENKVAEFRKTAPDFDIVIANPALPSLAPEAAKVVVQSDNGPAIAYHLAKNPSLATRIAKMEAVSQAAAIGRLEEQLVRAKTETKDTSKEPSKTVPPAKQVSVSKAPPPPKPVSGGTSPVVKPAELMSMEEFASQERARKLAQRKEKLALRQAFRR